MTAVNPRLLKRPPKLRSVPFKVGQQFASSDSRDLRRSIFTQRRKQWFDGRFKFSQSGKHAIVLGHAELCRLWFGLDPSRIACRTRNASQHIQQFYSFLFHSDLPVTWLIQLW